MTKLPLDRIPPEVKRAGKIVEDEWEAFSKLPQSVQVALRLTNIGASAITLLFGLSSGQFTEAEVLDEIDRRYEEQEAHARIIRDQMH